MLVALVAWPSRVEGYEDFTDDKRYFRTEAQLTDIPNAFPRDSVEVSVPTHHTTHLYTTLRHRTRVRVWDGDGSCYFRTEATLNEVSNAFPPRTAWR